MPKKSGFRTAFFRCAIYAAALCAVIVAFRLVYPIYTSQIEPFVLEWRLLRGFLDIVQYFPAIITAAFVVPSFLPSKREKVLLFSPEGVKSVISSIALSTVFSCIYALLLFFLSPQAQSKLKNIEAASLLYNDSRTSLRALLFKGGALSAGSLTDRELQEAKQLAAICAYIWSEDNNIQAETDEVLMELDSRRLKSVPAKHTDEPNSLIGIASIEGLNAGEALRYAREAMDKKRYYDANWLSTLAGRLAREGSVEEQAASRIASQSWTQLQELEPQKDEGAAYSVYSLKMQGYTAMVEEDWIRAYYLFRSLELIETTDRDVPIFIKRCEAALNSTSFFTDEISMSGALVKSNAVYSMPRALAAQSSGGRIVLTAQGLSLFDDRGFALNLEIMGFDNEGQKVFRVTTPYAKFVPLNLEGAQRTVVYMRSLDRDTQSLMRESEWEVWQNGISRKQGRAGFALPFESGEAGSNGASIALPISYENLSLLSRINAENNLSGNFLELNAAATKLQDYGILAESLYAAEIRLVFEPLLLLPLSIFALTLGWRYRVRQGRALSVVFIPMLFALPFASSLVLTLCRDISGKIAVWTILNANPFMAHVAAFSIAAALFVISLFALSYQHE